MPRPQAQSLPWGRRDQEDRWAREQWTRVLSDPSRQGDPPDQAPLRQHQVCRWGRADLSHLFVLLDPAVRNPQEDRHRHEVTRPTLARDSWTHFPCCRKILPLPVLAVRPIIRTLDSIAG